MKNNFLWLAVTNDYLELPVFIENSSLKLSWKLGISVNHLFKIISQQKNIYKKLNLKIVKVTFEGDNYEEFN